MTPTAILETALYVDDLDAAERFYVDVLGLQVYGRVSGRHVFFQCGSQMLLLFNPATTSVPSSSLRLPVPVHGASGEGHVCFRADAAEIERWKAHLDARGIAIEADFVWPSGGRSIYFRDPAGNSVEFAEPRIWGLG